MASAGTIRKPCSILVRNAKPSSTPASTSHRARASSTARTVAYAAAVISSTSSASGLLNRNISVATGVVARIAPASSPAVGDDTRLHRGVEQRDRGDALQRLRHEDRPRVQPEDPHRQVHHPQRRRRLVDGDEVGRVERAEQERRPALAAGLGRRRVVLVGPARLGQPDQVQQRGAEQQRGQREPSRPQREWRVRGRVAVYRATRRSRHSASVGEWDGDRVVVMTASLS